MSHETVFTKTTEIGKAASDESEGNRVKELEGDKKLQGKYFDNLEVWKELMRRIYYLRIITADGLFGLTYQIRTDTFGAEAS